ncbi:hypothetical protein GCM10011318_22780 [Phaeocystidibacter marisrubri]|nr:TerB family tellurite resistance protein [Phaeocystidibacter marisrubri]GGH75593.1 hypothetical protein GCM10011318_22780 [Phaeocystidibacter marisrubri]
MIIFGTRGVKSTINTGEFNCPQCAEQKAYRHRKVTQFFTLYFIPLIPLSRVGEYVECNQCKGTFVPRVLTAQLNPSEEQVQAQYEIAVRNSLIMIMLADGVINDNEKTQILTILNGIGKYEATPAQLEAHIKKVQEENLSVSNYLSKIGPMLNEHGKEIVISSALSVAASDGEIDDSELRLIFEMGVAMQMSKTHLRAIMEAPFKKAQQN